MISDTWSDIATIGVLFKIVQESRTGESSETSSLEDVVLIWKKVLLGPDGTSNVPRKGDPKRLGRSKDSWIRHYVGVMATNRAWRPILNHIANDDFEAALRGQAN